MLSAAPFIAELPQDLAGRTTSLFTVHGRYGNNALNGDWELGITSNTSAPPQQHSQRTWGDGRGTRAEPFTFAITKIPASLTAPAATSGNFTIGGSNVKASYTDIASYEPNAIKIWARSTTTGSGVTIKDLKIKTPGVPGKTVFPGTVINVSQDLGPVFQEIIIAGVDFKSSPSGSVTLEGTVAMQFGNAPAPRGSSVQFHVIATHIPWVDLDVDSNNIGGIDDRNGRSGTDDPIEDRNDLPGVIVPVGGTRTKMVVHVAAGRTATLAFAQGVDMVRVYAQETGGNPVLEQGNETTTIGGGPPQTFWIEAFAPSASLADIAFTLTADTNGPPVRDIVRATAVAVNLDVSPSKVDEDGSQGLIYTFTRSMALPTPLTISYDVVGGTATEGIDYTGLPLATGGRSITIPANATTASVAVFPIPDSEIEYDETVVLTLLPGAGYGLGTRTVATGTILNDDYLLDLVLDGLPEETVPGPNELSPGAEILMGGGRTRLDLIIHSPANAGTVTLTVLSGADKITLWDAEEGGQQVQPGVWPVGQHPTTLWVEDTGLEGDFELVAMFQNKGLTKQDASNGKVVGAEWRTAWADPNGNQDGTNRITPKVESLTYQVDVDLETGDPAGVRPPGGPDDNAVKGSGERLNKWMEAFAAQAGLGKDDKGRQFVGLTKWDVPGGPGTFIKPSVKQPTNQDFRRIGNEVREGQMRNNIWRIEFVPVVAPWDWNATITLPEWKQFTTDADQLNPGVKKEWENFVDALAGHEKIHKEKWQQYVRQYEDRVDVFAKTRFFGEAADPNDRTAKVSAWNDAKRLFDAEHKKLEADLNALTVTYNEDQKLYDRLSDHGRNQKGYDPVDGKNTEAVNPGLKLLK